MLLFIAGLHVYWALGGVQGGIYGRWAIFGHTVRLITPLAYSGAAFLLVIGALTICGQAGLFATGTWSAYFGFGSWCLCAAFLLRALGNFKTFGLFKTIHYARFAYEDTYLYSPLCLALAVLAGVVASGPGPRQEAKLHPLPGGSDMKEAFTILKVLGMTFVVVFCGHAIASASFAAGMLGMSRGWPLVAFNVAVSAGFIYWAYRVIWRHIQR